MIQVVQASCPKCRNVLRIPADWIGRPMRCKLCREIFLSRPRQSVQIQPVAPVGFSAPTPLPPTAVSVAPMPNAVAAPSFAFDNDVDMDPATPLRPLRRRGGGGKRSVLL